MSKQAMRMKMAKKYKRGLWHILADFTFKSDEITFSVPIRLRKFKYRALFCEQHGQFPKGSREQECPFCKTRTEEKDVFMYCLYTDDKEFINLSNILNRYTLLTWNRKNFRHKPSVVAYATTLVNVVRGISYTLDIANRNRDKGMKPELNVVIHDISEAEIDKLYEKSENNRLLREM